LLGRELRGLARALGAGRSVGGRSGGVNAQLSEHRDDAEQGPTHNPAA
jgi:hypothetical protein